MTSVEDQLRRQVTKKGGTFCERCKCCEMRRQTCEDCDGVGSVCSMETDAGTVFDAALDPIQCETCGGTGGWDVCTCDDKGEHQERTT